MRFSDVNNLAASICGMKPVTTPFKPCPPDANGRTQVPRGPWYEYQFTNKDGLTIDCYLEYDAAERDSFDCPGHHESIDLCYALVNGIDISDVLSDDIKGLIEEEALASMEIDKWDSDYDRGEDRYNDRMAA